MLNYLKSVGTKRLVIMVLGNVVMALGVAMFKMSKLGNDPFNGMNMALADVTGIPYPVLQILVNTGFFILEIIFGRKYLGAGTIVNAVLTGYIVSFFYSILSALCGIQFSMPVRILWVLVGVVICSLGLSLYQQSDAGVSPFDSMALILDERFPKIPYFWCRMFCDGSAALVLFLAGGIIGLGTLATAFGLGPVIHFFDKHLTNKYILKK